MAGERVLVVDDEPGVRQALVAILADEGYAVAAVDSGEDGLRAAQDAPYDAILLDVWLPGMDGLQTLNRLRDGMVDAQVIMISGHGTVETAVRATKLGAFDFIEKPLSLDKTLVVVRNALRQRSLERRNRTLVAQIVRDTEIVGVGAHAERVRAEVDAAATVTAPVWIVGEAGSGRETVARRVHTLGSRAGQPFVPVPCAAMVGEGGAQALFGGEPGSRGLLDLASGGTLFLEEADRLPPEVQRRLASELSGGGEREVRLMASTRPGSGDLDPDLLAVLDVIRIRTVPLRERREDIPAFAARLLRHLSTEYGKPEPRLSGEAIRALQTYPWPGNVAELRNFLERLILTPLPDAVGVSDLPAPVGSPGDDRPDLYGEFPSLAEALTTFERYVLRRTLAACGGDRRVAARRLGLALEKFEARAKVLGVGRGGSGRPRTDSGDE